MLSCNLFKFFSLQTKDQESWANLQANAKQGLVCTLRCSISRHTFLTCSFLSCISWNAPSKAIYSSLTWLEFLTNGLPNVCESAYSPKPLVVEFHWGRSTTPCGYDLYLNVESPQLPGLIIFLIFYWESLVFFGVYINKQRRKGTTFKM